MGDEEMKKDSSETESKININKNNEESLDTCEIQDKDAYGDIPQDTTAMHGSEIMPAFTIVKEVCKYEEQNTSEERKTIESKSECNVTNSDEEAMQVCDKIDYTKDKEDITDSKEKD